jgi:hypothetical protein
MFSNDPYFDVHVFPAVTAFRQAKAELMSIEKRFDAEPTEEVVGEVKSAQQRFEAARLALRNATRVAPPLSTS